ncbi:MAG: hypothetical protein AB2385_14690 [Symbiobacterium sp.]|uniref:NADH-quinone oxidoreductase subunit B family protein n=1 Tax=Symbiobacterium sp. TaxID=1971213 RepID=UPI003463EF31
MGRTLVWLQGQSCGGNTISLLNARSPDFVGFLESEGIEVVYHPTLSTVWGEELEALLSGLAAGRPPLDLFLFEGAVPLGPRGTGRYSTLGRRPVLEVVRELAHAARYVVAVGNCAVHGGIPAIAPNPTDARGLQWTGEAPGGVLPPDFRSRGGLPVVNLTGCPAPPHLILWALALLNRDLLTPADLDRHGRITCFYGPEGGCAQEPESEHKHCLHCARMGWQPSGKPHWEEVRPPWRPVRFVWVP